MKNYSKKFKKFLTFVITLSMIFTAGVTGVYAGVTDEDHDPGFFDDLGILQELNKVEEQSDEFEVPESERDENENLDYMKLLATLGIFEGDENGELNPYKSITRAEFTVIVLRLAGMEDEYFMNIAPSVQNFTDVPTDSWYYGAIRTACEMKLVQGYGDGTFRPEQTVSFNEAVKLIICAIGYGGIAEETAEYPAGYLTVANKLKITRGIKADADDKTLRKTVGKMMYNSLEANALGRIIDNASGDTAFVENGETIGERYFGVVKRKGIIEGVGEMMLGGVSDRNSNVVYVSSEEYISDLASEMGGYVGSNAEIYVTADENAKQEIVYYSILNDNSTLILGFDDIYEVNEDYCLVEHEEAEKIKLGNEPSMLFNERAVVPFDYELIKPDYYDSITGGHIPYSGNVTFTDNDGDGKYDVVSVNAYKSLYLGKVLNLKKVIKDYFASEEGLPDVIDLNPRNNSGVEIVYEKDNGDEAAFSNMKAGYVVDIYESPDIHGMNKKLRIVITNRSISGKVNVIDEEYADIGGTRYRLSQYYVNSLQAYPQIATEMKPGDTVKVALNSNREIVYVINSAGKESLGYMLDYGKKDGAYFAQIAGTDGKVKNYTFAEKVSVNGEKYSAKDAAKSIENTGKNNAPVKFVADLAGNVKSLWLYELENPGLVQPQGTGKTIKFDARALSMGNERYSHTFSFTDVVDLAEVPIIGIDFGPSGIGNANSPESGKASVEPENTVKIDKSYIGVQRSSENYVNGYYEDRFYLVNYDSTKKECDMIIFNIGEGGVEEDAVAPYTLYSESSEGNQNRFMSTVHMAQYGSTAKDTILCVNKAYETVNDNGEKIWIVKGIQGGTAVSYTTAEDIKFLTSMNAEDDRINSLAPVQWTAKRGETYESSDEENWFGVSGAKDCYDPETGEVSYYGDTLYYFPERFRTASEPGIKMGDMAYISVNANGEIVEFVYIANAVSGPERTLCARPRRATMVRGFCWEPFYGMNKDSIDSYYLTNHNHASMTETDISETIRVTAWDGENDEFIIVTRDDLYGSDAYIPEYDSVNGYNKTGEFNNCWLLMNKYNWKCTEVVFVDYISNTY